MKQIQVFDPALCCSSGVCGTDVDQKLVDFSADVDWAKQNGALIERFNLAQQPMSFAENAAVKDLLQKVGEAALPVILVDDQVMLSGSYPTREVLAGWLGITLAPSVFSAQVAELVAIGAAIASNCEPCFKYHFDAARKLGVSNADMLQAVELAQKVKDSPAKAVRDLALRVLNPASADNTRPQSKAASSCCGGESSSAAQASTGCCGTSAGETAMPAVKYS
jgi:AhpD family alkylhydroperoxidase